MASKKKRQIFDTKKAEAFQKGFNNRHKESLTENLKDAWDVLRGKSPRSKAKDRDTSSYDNSHRKNKQRIGGRN